MGDPYNEDAPPWGAFFVAAIIFIFLIASAYSIGYTRGLKAVCGHVVEVTP